jgi:translocation and assembly module TamA
MRMPTHFQKTLKKQLKPGLFLLLIVPLLSYGKSSIIRYQITGINDPLLKNVQIMLDAEQSRILGIDKIPDSNNIKRFFANSPTVITQALEPYGYFTPTIRSELKHNNSSWTFYYKILPGPPIILQQLSVSIVGDGKDNPLFIKWRNRLTLQQGKIFNTEDYNKTKETFFNIAQNNGFLNATMPEHTIKIDVHTLTATVNLTFNTGKQYFYGPITFSTTKLNDTFLRKYLNIEQGEPFSVDKIIKLQQNLSGSGYFKRVNIEHNISKAVDSKIPIHIQLTQVDNMLYSIGAGYGTDTGYRGSLGWQWQLINPYGQHLSARYNASQIGNGSSITYIIPASDPLTEQYQLNVNTASYNTNAGQSSLQSYGGQYNVTRGKWKTTLGLAYQFEKYNIPTQTPKSVHLLMPSMSWMYLKTDKIMKPSYGTRFTVTIRGASEQVVSDTSFTQISLGLRKLISLNTNNRLYLRVDAGGTSSNDFSLVPLSLQFTAGGAQSVRGYAYQSLGPAPYLFAASQQYEYRVKGAWFAAVFHDVGNAFYDFSHTQLQQSGGIGVLWESPIGSMELDLAKAITATNNPVMVQFSIGTLL